YTISGRPATSTARPTSRSRSRSWITSASGASCATIVAAIAEGRRTRSGRYTMWSSITRSKVASDIREQMTMVTALGAPLQEISPLPGQTYHGAAVLCVSSDNAPDRLTRFRQILTDEAIYDHRTEDRLCRDVH